MLKHCKELFNHGFAIHWLKQASKQPIESGWTKGPRKTWEELRKSYTYGNNVGVRLGKASQLSDGSFLAVIDCDVKSGDPAHCREMEAKLGELLKGAGNTPRVTSGRGNGSRHIYVRTKEPVSPFRFGQSTEKVRVLMPSVKPSKHELATLDAVAIGEGYRLRAAWEISVMGEGQQVVLPPSIHPDSKAVYHWELPVKSLQNILLIQPSNVSKSDVVTPLADFNAEEVDLVSSELPDTTVEMILGGEGCTDRSAGLFTACVAMVKARFTDNQILSVLTDRETFLGGTAYEHTKSNSRKRAAEWVHKFTLAKVRQETSAAYLFADAVQVSDLDENGMLKQSDELTQGSDWQLLIERGSEKSGARPLPTLKNVVLILTHAVGPKVFFSDSFALRTAYGMKTPWGGVQGAAITDVDPVLVKLWLANQFRFEPSVNVIWEAIFGIAAKNETHPIREYLHGLPPWDGVERLGGYLKEQMGAEGPDYYLSEVFTHWMVGAVRRVFEPGCKHDWMLIFEGSQGLGKSTFVEILAGQKYFIDKLPPLDDKDAAQVLQGIWLVEMGELKELKRNEVETIKGFITRRVDKFRPTYGRTRIDAPRQCLFAGSTNAERYLKDDTGNRRFMPVPVKGKVDFERVASDRDQLWAESFALYQSGMMPDSRLSEEAEKYANTMQESRMVEDDSDIMKEKLFEFIETEMKRPESERFLFNKFKMGQLFAHGGPLESYQNTNWNYQMAAKAIKKLGGFSKLIKGQKFWEIKIDIK